MGNMYLSQYLLNYNQHKAYFVSGRRITTLACLMSELNRRKNCGQGLTRQLRDRDGLKYTIL
jgi:hypothetical protein